jgi:ribosomal protein L18
MNIQKLKRKQAERRRYRVRKAIYGTPAKPRLSVSRSNLHISAQLIDDLNGVTLAAATSQGKNSGLKHGGNVAAARAVGQKLAEAAKAKGIATAAFDRGQFRFHGRIAALAVAATEAGLVCTDLESVKAKMAPKPAAEAAPEAKAEEGSEAEGRGQGEGRRQAEGRQEVSFGRRDGGRGYKYTERYFQRGASGPATRGIHGPRATRQGRRRLARQRAGRFRRQDPAVRLRGEGRAAVQLQRAGRRRRPPRQGVLRVRQGQRGAAGRGEGHQRRRGNVGRSKKVAKRGDTIPHRVIGKYGASRVIMVPAGPGTGVKAGPGVREVLQACGITNILTKVHGSTNPLNLVKATLNGLSQLRTKEDVARLRGVQL